MVNFFYVTVAIMASRSERLAGLLVEPKHTKCDVPMIDEFLQCVEPSITITTTKDLHLEYMAYITSSTTDQRVITLAGGYKRFAMRMRKTAFTQVESPKRGYKVTVNQGALRRRRHVGGVGASRVASPPDVVCVNQTKGSGCFATATYHEGQIVCPYLGQIID